MKSKKWYCSVITELYVVIENYGQTRWSYIICRSGQDYVNYSQYRTRLSFCLQSTDQTSHMPAEQIIPLHLVFDSNHA